MLGWAHTEQTQSTTSQAVHLPPFEKGEKTERPPEEGLENKGIRGALTVAELQPPYGGDFRWRPQWNHD